MSLFIQPFSHSARALEGHLRVTLHREVSLTTDLLLQTFMKNWPFKGLKG